VLKIKHPFGGVGGSYARACPGQENAKGSSHSTVVFNAAKTHT